MFFGPAIILAVLAAVGIGPSLGHQRDQPRRRSAPAVASQNKSSSESDDKYSANHLLGEFLARERDSVEEKKLWWVDSDSKPADPQPSLEFLIATLPDPSSGPLRYQFDGQIEAILSALTADGYKLVDFAVPWVDEAKEQSGESNSDDRTHSERDPGCDHEDAKASSCAGDEGRSFGAAL
jgi:hypothetical protein